MAKYDIPDFTIKEVTPEEHRESLKLDLEQFGLKHTIKFRCDEIAEEVHLLNLSYNAKSYIFERLNDIIEIAELAGDTDGKYDGMERHM